jgi:hypothetical protein
MPERNRTRVRVTGPRQNPDARDIGIVGARKGSGEDPLPFLGDGLRSWLKDRCAGLDHQHAKVARLAIHSYG